MARKRKLDLTGIVWPVCLLKFKSVLDEVEPGYGLEVSLCDPDVVRSLGKIIDNSPGLTANINTESGRHCIRIHKREVQTKIFPSRRNQWS
jgi:TusA-related sulfurtransferase